MMIKFRETLIKYLKTKHPRVYFQDAPSTAPYPYLVIDFHSVPNGEGQEIITVDIDGWDRPKNGDTTEVETLMDLINGNGDIFEPTGLDKRTLTTEDLVVSFYLDNRMPLTDPDKSIKRRKYIYQARLIERG